MAYRRPTKKMEDQGQGYLETKIDGLMRPGSIILDIGVEQKEKDRYRVKESYHHISQAKKSVENQDALMAFEAKRNNGAYGSN